MTETFTNSNMEKRGSAGYRVRVRGCLSDEFIAGLDLAGERDLEQGETYLLVSTTDQAALYGLMNRLRDLGLTLISVTLING